MMNKIKDENVEMMIKLKKVKNSLESSELPVEYSWFQFFVYLYVLLIGIWGFINYRFNTTSLDSMKSYSDKLLLFKGIEIQLLGTGYRTRRFLLSNMVPGQSTYQLIYGQSEVEPNTLPMSDLSKVFYQMEIYQLMSDMENPLFSQLFSANLVLPHPKNLYRNPMISTTFQFQRAKRPQESLFAITSNAFLLSDFVNWDGQLIFPGSQNSEIFTQMTHYYMIVDNSYYTTFENLEFLDSRMSMDLDNLCADELRYHRILLYSRIGFIFVVMVALTYLLNLLSKRAGDVWDFYGNLEKPWILVQSARIEKFIIHLNQSKSQRKELLKLNGELETDKEDENENEGLQFEEELSLDDEDEDEDMMNRKTQSKRTGEKDGLMNPKDKFHQKSKSKSIINNQESIAPIQNDFLDRVQVAMDQEKQAEEEKDKIHFDMEERAIFFNSKKFTIMGLIMTTVLPIGFFFILGFVLVYYQKTILDRNVIQLNQSIQTYGNTANKIAQTVGEALAELSRDQGPTSIFSKYLTSSVPNANLFKTRQRLEILQTKVMTF